MQTVLTCTEVQYAVLCQTLERYLKLLQNSIACLSFVQFEVLVLLQSASA
jgi:hypothetical protein